MPRRRPAALPDRPFRGTDAVAQGLLTPDQLRGPAVRRLFRDVYVRAGLRVTHATRCAGAALIVPADAVLTGRSAAVLHGVDLAGPADPVELVVDEADRFGPVRGLRIKRTALVPEDGTPWREVRRATAGRMGFDLARRPGLLDAVADVDAALHAGALTVSDLRRYVEGRSEHGVVQARCVLGLADGRAESRPESTVRVILRRAGLEPDVQYAVRDAGGLVARVDLAFPAYRVAVEYDGAWHALRTQLARDRRRLNRLDAAGWTTVFVTADMLRGDHREIVDAVAAALRRAGARTRRVARCAG